MNQPKKIYLINNERYFDAYATNLADDDIEYVSVDALKEWFFKNYGDIQFYEKFEQFLNQPNEKP